MINGKIHMPPSTVPDELSPPTKEVKESDPNVERIYAVFNRLRDELIASLK